MSFTPCQGSSFCPCVREGTSQQHSTSFRIVQCGLPVLGPADYVRTTLYETVLFLFDKCI
jgi:hypothetical protein